ncbi:hypothetical protein [Janthinobacterium sp. RA13]|uniref:hypothetical protein n=1 Tax=Janthinobacterium sp. RA13 TaxID=1502762 RepID=UPI000690DE72|nr:hypothetical protein [Janthinobacterium sp. RA13]
MTTSSHSGATELLKMYQQALARTDGDKENGLLDIPDDIVAWLAELCLLYGVPFEYLVPDAAMLPPESIRFFYMDQNWTDCAVNGAVNIALGSSQDYAQVLRTFERLAQQAALAVGNVRPKLRRKALAPTLQVGGTVTGVLLRSAAVTGWPGMEVNAFFDVLGTRPVPLLRLDRLSDNVLLALFNGVPQLVNFSEPPEGLHFGVIGVPAEPGAYQIALRGLGGAFPAGKQINDSHGDACTSPITFRDGDRASGVLDIVKCKDAMVDKLVGLGAWQAGAAFTSSQFAVEMVKGAGLQQFEPATGKICNGNLVKA